MTDLTTNLLSAWNYDESSGTVFDSVGSRDLSVVGSVGVVDGYDGNARSFPGGTVSNYLRSESPTVAVGTTFTIRAFFNGTNLTQTASGGSSMLMCIGGSSQNYRLEFDGTNKVFNLAGWTGGSTEGIYYGKSGVTYYSTFNDGDWHEIVGTRDGATWQIYVDGVLHAETNTGSTYGWGSFPITISQNYNYNQQHVNGDIDEEAIWDRYFTTFDIDNILGKVYDSTSGSFKSIATASTEIQGALKHNYKDLFITSSGTSYLDNATFDDGTSDGWITIGSNATSSVSSGEYTHDQTSGNSIAFRSGVSLSGDWTAEFKVKLAIGGDGGVCWNVQDQNNGYMLTARTSTSLVCYKRVGGVWNLIGSINDTALVNGVYYVYKIVKSGSTYSFYIDDVFKFDATDSTFSSGYLGSRPNNTSQVYDYVRAYSGENPGNTGLVAGYDFKGDAKDFSGNGYDGTVSGASLTSNHFGVPNSAYSFNGTSDYIKSVPASNFPTSFTVSVWAKHLTSNVYNTMMGIDKTESGPIGLLYLQKAVDNRWKCIVVNTDDTQFMAESDATYTDTNWHHIVGTYDDSSKSVKLYVDGILQSTSPTLTGTRATPNDYMEIGAGWYSDAITDFFNGSIAFPLLFDKELSADEVKRLYNLTKSKFIYPFPQFRQGGLLE